MDTMLEDTVGEYSRGLAVVLSVFAGRGRGVGVGVKTGIVVIYWEIFLALYFLCFQVWTRRREWEGVSG